MHIDKLIRWIVEKSVCLEVVFESLLSHYTQSPSRLAGISAADGREFDVKWRGLGGFLVTIKVNVNRQLWL